jgi:uncharacterized protein YggE
MRGKISGISTTVVALLIIVVALASSTLVLAYNAFQTNSVGSTTGTHSTGGNLVLPSLGAATADAQSASSSGSNSITISGSGEVSYTPDEALIQVSVQTTNTTAGAATTSNAQDMTNVIRALNGIGILNSSLAIQGYSLSPNYANCYSSCVPQITGYTVSNSLQVNITSSNPTELGLRAGRVIDTSVKAGANGINLSFGVSNSMVSELTNEALQNAVASADSQAKAIASSLGVSLSGVISASEGGSSYYPDIYGTFATATIAMSTTTVAYPTPITVGTQTISETVQVVYSIS